MGKPLITIGADPELFLEQNGHFRSAIDRISGCKSIPTPLSKDGFFILADNVAAEFNIPPAKEVKEFAESIQWAMAEIVKEVTPFGYTLSSKASALFPPTELVDPRAQEFGCDPDFNAWNGGMSNPKPKAADSRLRSCGGHIHVGYPMNSGVDRFRLIQLMDLYLGVPSIMMDEDQDRRQLYGKAGSFRIQPYGVEYRTLSNFWCMSNEKTEWAFQQAMRAAEKAIEYGPRPEQGHDLYTMWMESYDLEDDIQNCINHSDVNLAQHLIAQHDLVLA